MVGDLEGNGHAVSWLPGGVHAHYLQHGSYSGEGIVVIVSSYFADDIWAVCL